MYKGVIFTLGSITAERELGALRKGESPLQQQRYLDGVREIDPSDGYEFHRPDMPPPKREIPMRPVEATRGGNTILIVPTRACAWKKGGGTVVERQNYFDMTDNVVGVGLCRSFYEHLPHGTVVFPYIAEISPGLWKEWSWNPQYLRTSIPSRELQESLRAACESDGLPVATARTMISVRDLQESRSYSPVARELGYSVLDQEMAWLFGHSYILRKNCAGALVVSDIEGEEFIPQTFYHSIREETHEGANRLLRASVRLLLEI